VTMTIVPILASFHYFRRSDVPRLIGYAQQKGAVVDFFADSGAFSAYTTGATITVKQYATWLTVYAGHINCAATLDVIGDPKATARNTLALEDMVGETVTIIPTFHVGSPWPDLHRWCKSHRYVALGGGAVLQSRERAFVAWAVRCHQIAAQYGTRLHGFGMTRPPIPELLRWYSVDSSYWSSAQRNGTLSLFDRHAGRFVRLRVGTRQVADRPGVAAVVRTYGADPRTVATDGFGRVGIRGDVGRDDRRWLAEAAIETWLRYGDYLRDRHGPLTAPHAVRYDGPKVYLAAGSEDDYRLLVDVAVRHAAPTHPEGANACQHR
jgi:hypothetical protein